MGELVLAPDAADHLDRFIEERVALLEVDAQRLVLAADVAGGDGEREPSVGQRVECRRRLGHQERIAVRQHEDVGDQAQPVRDGGTEREGGERVEGVVAAGVQPFVRWERGGR